MYNNYYKPTQASDTEWAALDSHKQHFTARAQTRQPACQRFALYPLPLVMGTVVFTVYNNKHFCACVYKEIILNAMFCYPIYYSSARIIVSIVIHKYVSICVIAQ